MNGNGIYSTGAFMNDDGDHDQGSSDNHDQRQTSVGTSSQPSTAWTSPHQPIPAGLPIDTMAQPQYSMETAAGVRESQHLISPGPPPQQFPPSPHQHQPPTSQSLSTPTPTPADIEKARIATLLEINTLLFRACLATTPPDTPIPMTPRNKECMERLQANLAYLATMADSRTRNGKGGRRVSLPVPKVLTAPGHVPEVEGLYRRLAGLFAGAGAGVGRSPSITSNTSPPTQHQQRPLAATHFNEQQPVLAIQSPPPPPPPTFHQTQTGVPTPQMAGPGPQAQAQAPIPMSGGVGQGVGMGQGQGQLGPGQGVWQAWPPPPPHQQPPGSMSFPGAAGGVPPQPHPQPQLMFPGGSNPGQPQGMGAIGGPGGGVGGQAQDIQRRMLMQQQLAQQRRIQQQQQREQQALPPTATVMVGNGSLPGYDMGNMGGMGGSPPPPPLTSNAGGAQSDGGGNGRGMALRPPPPPPPPPGSAGSVGSTISQSAGSVNGAAGGGQQGQGLGGMQGWFAT